MRLPCAVACNFSDGYSAFIVIKRDVKIFFQKKKRERSKEKQSLNINIRIDAKSCKLGSKYKRISCAELF